MSQKTVSVAIDGPAGAGKSTLARRLAKEMNFLYVDTGAMYRAVAWYVHQQGVALGDAAATEPLLKSLQLDLFYRDGEQRVSVNGKDVSEEIRLPEISMAASAVSALPCVRAFLLEQQRELARKHNVLMDGRDIGTVVLPDATLKIFLSASAEARAKRRYEELCAKGVQVTYDEVLSDMQQRDEQDRTRAVSPLRRAEDAIPVDTTGNTLEQSVDRLRELIVCTLKEKQEA